MGKPSKLSAEKQAKVDEIKRGCSKKDVPSNALPANPGTKILKYSWEDSMDSAKIYIDELPGYDTWGEADVLKEGCSVYWDDRESLILLLTNSDDTKSWYVRASQTWRRSAQSNAYIRTWRRSERIAC